MNKHLVTLITVTAFCIVSTPVFAQQTEDADNPDKESADSSGDELVEVKSESANEEGEGDGKTAEQKTVSETADIDDVSEAEQEDLVDLSFKNADIKDVLRSLAAMRPDATIMIDPDVEGTASFELQNFEWRAALDLIAKTHQLAVSKEGDDVYIVRPEGEETETMRQADKAEDDEEEGDRKIFKEEGVVIEFYTREEIENLPDKKLLKLYISAAEELPQEEDKMDIGKKRKALITSPKEYIKRITVDNRNPVQVVEQLLQNADLDYSFSGGLAREGKNQNEEGDEEDEGDSTKVPVKKVSLQFRNTTVSDTLRNVCRQGNISCEKSGNIWKIEPMETDKAPLNLHTFEISYIPLNETLVKLLGDFIERGTVKAGESKTLVANVTESGAEKIRKILDAIDIPTKQVLIEARFFELTDDFDKELGINWQDLGTDEGAEFSLSPEDLTWDYDRGELSKPREAILSMPEFSVVLHALQKDSGAKQLSNPKVIVSSGEDAMIHIGKQEPILKSQTETTDAGTVTTYQLDDNFETEDLTGYLDLGTRLTVTPTVKTKDKVYVSVTPRLTSITKEKEAGDTSYPILFTTRVNTQYTMPSGKTVAIGGLVKERDRSSVQKVPFLGDIPMLGRLFSYNQKTTEKSETIVFLTVKVMEGDELKTTAGIPIRGRLVQDEVEQIRKEDAAGAEYDYDRLKKILEEELNMEESDKSKDQETENAEETSEDTETEKEEIEEETEEAAEEAEADAEKAEATAEEAEAAAEEEEAAAEEAESTNDSEKDVYEIEKEISAIENEMEKIEEDFEEEETDTEKSNENNGEETTVDENSAENE